MKKLLLTTLFITLAALGWIVRNDVQATAAFTRNQLKSAQKMEPILIRIKEGPHSKRLSEKSSTLLTFEHESQVVSATLERVDLVASIIVALSAASVAAVWLPRQSKEAQAAGMTSRPLKSI